MDRKFKDLYNEIEQIRVNFTKKNYGLDLQIDDFIDQVKFTTPQKYGVLIQSYLSNLFNFKNIKSSAKSGDYQDPMGNFYELKTSFINSTNKNINVVQIRLFEDISSYLIFAVDLNNEEYDYHFYSLTKEQMTEEVEMMGSNCHIAQNQNEEKEYRISIKFDPKDQNFIRWNTEYKIPLDFRSLSLKNSPNC